MYLLHAINSDRQHNCWMSSDRLQYILEGKRKFCNRVNLGTLPCTRITYCRIIMYYGLELKFFISFIWVPCTVSRRLIGCCMSWADGALWINSMQTFRRFDSTRGRTFSEAFVVSLTSAYYEIFRSLWSSTKCTQNVWMFNHFRL